MPVVVDASTEFDPDGVRFTEGVNATGLPSHLLTTYYLRRAFKQFDAYGAESTAWAVLAIKARIYMGKPTEVTGEGRQSAVGQYRLATNSGSITHLDQVASDDGWWRLPEREARSVWLVDGDPYPVTTTGGTVHHYEVPVRRVDG